MLGSARAMMVAALLVITACAQPAPANTRLETIYHDLLFAHNLSRGAYVSDDQQINLYIDEHCYDFAMSSSNSETKIKLMKKYRLLELSKYKNSSDANNNFRDYLQNPLNYMRNHVPEWAQGSDKILDDGGKSFMPCKGRELDHRPTIEMRLVSNRAAFDALWASRPPTRGFQSTDRNTTPECHIRVEAKPDNKISRTVVSTYMPQFTHKMLSSRSFAGCGVRGLMAAFGLPGIIDWTDDKLILFDHTKNFSPGSGFALGAYWTSVPMGATVLVDKPGERWPPIRQRLRKMLQDHAKRTRNK